MSGDSAKNQPVYVTDTCTVIYRPHHDVWPWLIKRRTDGKSVETTDLRSALCWVEQVASTTELSADAKQTLHRWE